jgi:hypothetical protein
MSACVQLGGEGGGSEKHRSYIKVRSHRKRTAAANCDLWPRREGFRTVLRKIASSPSNRRQADAADQSSSRRTVVYCLQIFRAVSREWQKNSLKN